MRTSSTFSILFWIYAKRIRNNQAPLYARITVDRKKLNISLKRRVDTRYWNPKIQRIRGTSEEARTINQYLDEVHSKLFQCYQELRADHKRITPQAIKSKFVGDEKIDHYTLRNIIEYHNANMFSKLHYNTSRLYLTSQRYILLFLKKKHKVEDIELADLDYKFILDFETFLRNHKPRNYRKKIGNNAVMKHIQRLRRMITLAYQLEWIDRDPFHKFKQKLLPTQRGYLTSEELNDIEKLNIESMRLQTVRDLFIFSCYTGISYIDLVLLNNQSLVLGMDKTTWIVTQRQKTRNSVKIPLLAKALVLIERYKCDKRSKMNGTLFPMISNQKMNLYLKEIAVLAKIEKNLTFHMARHTFATTVTLTNGVPIETISKMLGHSKLTTTQIYAKVLERKVCDDMQVLRQKLENNVKTGA
ncbi:site-specific integrase [Croceitalea sp. MTPC9]|uniref:Site-specific integrase n=1 Tax=Croceitalea marina TaxID=1775166 RepID=A0ABW5N2P9_9FLAO|nr:site-specific integrase [Croceitalea sp. MTPC6]GMN18251.1 site-specific integrase [Croceitalea sp. MTPC9]